MGSVENGDLAGLVTTYSDGKDDNYTVELPHHVTASFVASSSKREYTKRARVDTKSFPVMEVEGKSFRVLGFNQRQRATFVKVLMRFGLGEFDWAEFVPRLKQKTYEEIENYGHLFITHLLEEISDSATFSDGVPKEGLRVEDVRVRVGYLILVSNKVKSASVSPEKPLFDDDIISQYPTLKGGEIWKEVHDATLLRAVSKHGYRRWQDILDDKDLKIQEAICEELNIPILSPTCLANNQFQTGLSMANAEPSENLQKELVGQNGPAVETVPEGPDVITSLNQIMETQRRQIEFIENRMLLLEKSLVAEYRKALHGDATPDGIWAEEPRNSNEGADVATTSAANTVTELLVKLPHLEPIIAAAEIVVYQNIYDWGAKRLELVQYYDEMHEVLAETHQTLENKLPQLEGICKNIEQLLSTPDPRVEDNQSDNLNFNVTGCLNELSLHVSDYQLDDMSNAKDWSQWSCPSPDSKSEKALTPNESGPITLPVESLEEMSDAEFDGKVAIDKNPAANTYTRNAEQNF